MKNQKAISAISRTIISHWYHSMAPDIKRGRRAAEVPAAPLTGGSIDGGWYFLVPAPRRGVSSFARGARRAPRHGRFNSA
jgi:hypothetical protein